MSSYSITVTTSETLAISFQSKEDMQQALDLLDAGYSIDKLGGHIRTLGHDIAWEPQEP